MSNQRLLVLKSVILLAGLCVSNAHGQFAGLTTRIPSGANAIVVLDVDKIQKSPLAQKENWREQRENAAAAGLTVLPATADYFIMAANLDLDFMQSKWEVSLSKVRTEPSMPQLAARFGGSVDEVASRPAALLPDDSYIVKFNPSMVGSMRPGNRQSVARWLRQTSVSSDKRLSPYLKNAVEFAEGGTPIIVALDMSDQISADEIRARAGEMKSLENTNIDIDQLADAAASIQGVMLGITIKDRIRGSIRVDFDKDVTFLKDVAKPLLLEVLANRSAMISEFEDWDLKVTGKRIQITGDLYQSGMRRIMSILDAPPALNRPAYTSPGEQTEENLQQLSSQQYFKMVGGLVDDLQGKKKQTMGQVGIWCGRYARKIDELPMLNVDERLLDYGAFVSDALREAEAVLRGVGGKSRVRQLNAPAQYRSVGRWGSDGWMGTRYYGGWVESPRLEAQNRTRIRTEERVQGASSVRDITREVNEATAQVRREMTQKYKVEF